MFQPRPLRSLSASLPAVTVALALALTLAVSSTCSIPARADDAAQSPRRYIPADGLVGYFEYEGLDDHARAWQATAAHDLLVKSKAGSMLREVFRQTFDGGLDIVFEGLATSEDITDLADVLLRNGVVVAAYGKMDEAVIVLRRVARPDNRGQLGKMRAFAQFVWMEFGSQTQASTRIRGRTVFRTIENDDGKGPDLSNPFIRVQPRGKPGDIRLSTWREGDDWILVVDKVPGAEKLDTGQKPHRDLMNRVLDSIDGKCPNVTRHPGYLSAVADAKDLKGFEPNGMYFAEVQPLVASLFPDDPVGVVKSICRQLGLDGLVRIVGRWGFQGRATLTSLRLEMPAPRRGLLTAFNQPAFRTDHLPVIPPNARSFVLASFATDRFTVQVRDAARKLDEYMLVGLAPIQRRLSQSPTARQVEELVRHLGPEWALIDIPEAAAAPGAGRAMPHPVLVAAVDDATAFDRLASQLAAQADRQLGQLEKSRTRPSNGGHQAASHGMKRLPPPDRGFRIDLPGIKLSDGKDSFSFEMIEGQVYSLYLVLDERSVALAFDLDSARRVLKQGGPSVQPWKASGEVARALDGLPPSLTLLSVSDPDRCGIPGWIAGVPGMVRWLTITFAALQDMDDHTAWVLLNLLGEPRPGQVWLRLAPQDVPTVDEIRSYFFPSILAAAVDDRGYRIIQREPLPFAGLASELAFHHGWKIDWSLTDWPRVRYQFNVTSPWIESKR